MLSERASSLNSVVSSVPSSWFRWVKASASLTASGALVSADEQDVQHVVVRERAALGHCHLAFGVGQAGSVQVLVLVRADLTHLADAAVIIAQQVELAVDVKGRQHSQHGQNADNND